MIVNDGKYTVEQQLLKYVTPSIIKRARKLQLLLIESQWRCGMFVSFKKRKWLRNIENIEETD